MQETPISYAAFSTSFKLALTYIWITLKELYNYHFNMLKPLLST